MGRYKKTRRDHTGTKDATVSWMCAAGEDRLHVILDNQALDGVLRYIRFGFTGQLVVAEIDLDRHIKQVDRLNSLASQTPNNLSITLLHTDLFDYLEKNVSHFEMPIGVWADLETSRLTPRQLKILSRVQGFGSITLSLRDRQQSMAQRWRTMRHYLPRIQYITSYARQPSGTPMALIRYGSTRCTNPRYEVHWAARVPGDPHRLKIKWRAFSTKECTFEPFKGIHFEADRGLYRIILNGIPMTVELRD